MQSVILIRHAASSGQAPNAELTDDGHQQAQELAKALARLNPDALFASPYQRAQQTVQPFAKASGLTINTLNDLQERVLATEPVPNWLHHIQLSFNDRDHALTGGESLNDTCARAITAISDIRRRGAKRPVAVSHGNLIASLLHQIDPNFGYDNWKSMKNPDLFEIHFTDQQPSSFSRL